MNLRIVFMGTPDFSVPVLKGLIANYEVAMVVCQPDKKVGRKQEIVYPPVKKIALSHQIEVFQPEKIRKDYQKIIDCKPDIIITCAYGQIIPKILLDAPKYRCVNVHASLLPKLRGGAPIHHAIMDGLEKTGITIMYMEEKMDAGDILAQRETEIMDSDTLETLHDRLSVMGCSLLLDTLPDLILGKITPIKQDEEQVSFGYNIKREEEFIDFNRPTREVFNHIRGLNPHPSSYALLEGKEVKLFEVKISQNQSRGIPGEIIDITKKFMTIKTLDGAIDLFILQKEGKKKMSVLEFFNGNKKEDYIGKVFNQ